MEDNEDYTPPWWLLLLAVLFVLTILVGGWVWFQVDMYNNSRPQIATPEKKETYYLPSWAPGHQATGGARFPPEL